MAGRGESLDRGACWREGVAGDLLGRRLFVGEREVGREGLYRQVVLLGVAVLEWEHTTGMMEGVDLRMGMPAGIPLGAPGGGMPNGGGGS